jgi:ABC-2 type transport system permease protein
MPIFNLGYRPWEGKVEPGLERWWVIAETGIRLAWRSMWLRRLLLLAWGPAVFIGLGFFTFERSIKDHLFVGSGLQTGDGSVAALGMVFSRLPNWNVVMTAFAEAMAQDGELSGARHTAWAWLLLTFFRYPQGVLLILVVGIVAPPLIAHDLRSKAFLIYFSRPITTWKYLLGKAGIVCVYLALISTLPALCLYVLGVLLSPDLGVLRHTWDLPLRILAASAVVMIPTTSLALCYSSLTHESRFAGFGWFVTWGMGWIAYFYLTGGDLEMVVDAPASDRWALVSLYHMLGHVQGWIFGLESFGPPSSVVHSLLILSILTVVSLAILVRRITAPLQV